MTLAVMLLFGIIFSFMLLIGYFIGLEGMNIVIYPMAMAVFMIFFQWIFSDKLIQAMARIEWLKGPEDNPTLWNLVVNRAEEANVKIEKIGISKMKNPNAFVFGKVNAKLVVTQGLLDNLSSDPEALEGIIAHEIGHIKHNDMRIMMLISTLPLILYMIAYSFMWGSYGGRDRGTMVMIGVLAWVFYFLMNLGVLLVSRYREYYADQYSKEVLGPRPLIRGLVKIAYLNNSRINSETHKAELSPVEATLGSFFVMDSRIIEDVSILSEISHLGSITSEEKKKIEKNIKKEKKMSGIEILMTHPLTYKRILRLYETES
ncbi:MAG: M48 family metalloprotease [Candidatus Helarchaeota archaeon]